MRSPRESYLPLFRYDSACGVGTGRVSQGSVFIILIASLFWLFPALFAAASPAPPLDLDDAAELLLPKRSTTEPERDRIEALTLWAAGRSLRHRGDNERALRCFQRALRCDPKSSEIVWAVVELAADMDRHAVAARYARKDVEPKGFDPMTLRRLGVYLAGEGDWTSAVRLYEKAVAVRKDAKKSAADIFLLMEMGRLYLLTGDNNRAADCFATVARAAEHPDEFELDKTQLKSLFNESAATYQYMGDAFLAANRLKDARAAFQKVEKHRPDEAMRLFNLARVHAKAGKHAEAIGELDICFTKRIDGLGVAPYEELADVLDKLGRKGELIGRLEKLHAAQPDNLPLGYFLAARRREAGNIDGAESLYRKLIKIQPTPLGYRKLTDILRRAKRFDDLFSLLGESVEKIGVMRTFEGNGQHISGNSESLRGLVEAARKAIGRSPDKAAYGKTMAVALLTLEAEQYEMAGEFFELAVAADPQRADESLMLWGVGLLSANRSAEAEAIFRRAINRNKQSNEGHVFHFYLSGALALENKVDEALKEARIAAEGNNRSARYRGRAAWVLYYCQRNDEAMEAHRQLIDELDADHLFSETREVMRESRMAMSNIAAQKGDEAQAEEWLEQVLDEFPDNPGALNDLGFLWAKQDKHLQRAERMIRQAVAAEPENMAFRDSLGWVLYRTEKYTEAVAELENAAKVKPDGVILEHLGDAYLKAGQREKALAAWRRAVEEFRKEKDVTQERKVKDKILQF